MRPDESSPCHSLPIVLDRRMVGEAREHTLQTSCDTCRVRFDPITDEMRYPERAPAVERRSVQQSVQQFFQKFQRPLWLWGRRRWVLLPSTWTWQRIVFHSIRLWIGIDNGTPRF